MMAEYTIVPGTNGFDIKVISTGGARQTMLGFATESDAEEWIEQDRQREIAVMPAIPSVVDLLSQPLG